MTSFSRQRLLARGDYVTPFMEHHLREFAREAYVSLAFMDETEALPHRRAVLTFHRGGYDMKMPNFLVPFVHSSLLKHTTEDVAIIYKKDKMGWHPWLLRAQSKVIEYVRDEDRSCGAEAGLYPLSTMFGYKSKGKYGEWREESMVFAAFDEAVRIAQGTKSRLDAAAGKAHAAAHHNFNPNLIYMYEPGGVKGLYDVSYYSEDGFPRVGAQLINDCKGTHLEPNLTQYPDGSVKVKDGGMMQAITREVTWDQYHLHEGLLDYGELYWIERAERWVRD